MTTTEEEEEIKQTSYHHNTIEYDDNDIVAFLSRQVPLDHTKQQHIIEHHQQKQGKKTEHQQAPSSVVPWDTLTEIAFMGDIIEGKIVGFNRGGAIVRLFHSGSTSSTGTKSTAVVMKGVKAFLPHSHLSDLQRVQHRQRGRDDDNTVDAEEYDDCVNDDECDVVQVGDVLPMKIIDLDVDTNKLVVSHREALKELLSVGDVVTGTVAAIQPYGAFIQFHYGGVGTITQTALLHKNNISHNGWKLQQQGSSGSGSGNDNQQQHGFVINECFRNPDLGETDKVLLEVGSKVRCMINEYDKYNGRISLSTKALEVTPGDFLCDPQSVFDHAEETAIVYKNRIKELQLFLSNKVLPAAEDNTSLSAALLTAMNQQSHNNNNDGDTHNKQQRTMTKHYRP